MTDLELHVSDLRWDRLLAGELAQRDKVAVLQHADACPACAARLAALTAEHQAFAGRGAFQPAGVRRRARRGWAIGSSMAAAVAVTTLVVALRTRPGTPGEPDEPGAPGERTKGHAASLVLAAGSAGRLTPVSTGDRIRPGDSVQAAYTTTRDGFGAVLSRDGTGKAMAYVPAGGAAMVALPAGVLASFPASTVLDDVVGEEVVAVVWCQAAHPLAPLIAELAATGDLIAPGGCTVRRVVLDKRAESP